MDLYLPFNSVAGDRKHTAEDIAGMFAAVMTNGVHPSPGDALFVEAAGGWTVRICAGRCVIEGRLGLNSTAKTLTLNPPASAYSRIDRVVLRCDYVNRMITEAIREGTPAASPAGSALQRDEHACEICLAEITIPYNATAITQAEIKDTRQDSTMCGVINSLIRVEPETLFDQYQAIWNNWSAKYYDEVEAWLAHIKVMTAGGENQVISDVAYLKTEKADKSLQFFSQTVAVASWVADSTYSYFACRADISLRNVTADMIPRVIFGADDAATGNFAAAAMALDGYVRIYAQSKPDKAVTIPTIICEKAV